MSELRVEIDERINHLAELPALVNTFLTNCRGVHPFRKVGRVLTPRHAVGLLS